MRKNILIAAAVVAVLVLGGLGYFLFQRPGGHKSPAPPPQQASAAAPVAGPAASGTLPDPVFLVLDRAAVMSLSKAGQDITRQMQPLVNQAQASLGAQRTALDRQAQQLQQDTSVTGAARDKAIAALDAKQQALAADAQRRQTELQNAMAAANAELGKAVAQIVRDVVKEHGANMVLDRAALPQVDPAFDITAEVIKRLDGQLTTVKVTAPKK